MENGSRCCSSSVSGGLRGHVDQQPVQRRVRLARASAAPQRRLAALDAALAGVDDGGPLGRQVRGTARGSGASGS